MQRHLANDVAVDAQGNAYVTDSHAGRIYRVDREGHASVFAEDAAFHATEGYGLNGIVHHPDGYLLVGKHATGELFRIDTAAPFQVHPVRLDEPVVGVDGITLDRNPRHLVAALNRGGARAACLVSDDGWHSARVVATQDSVGEFPTAVTRGDGRLWLLSTRLRAIAGAAASQAAFEIQPVACDSSPRAASSALGR